ncbi:formyltransferase family protein [Aurantimonas coralicida]
MICIAGKNEIAVGALIFLIEQGWRGQIVVCPNRTDTGKSHWQPSLVRFAREFGIPILPLEEIYTIADLIFISLEFDRLVNTKKFSTDRIYNIHFSALPAFKGMYTSALPILARAEYSGVTLHEIDHGIDTGRIIEQRIFKISKNCTARELYFMYLHYGQRLFQENFETLVDCVRPEAHPQSARGSSYFSKKSIDYTNISMNLLETAEGVACQLRAFSFREYQIPNIRGIPVGRWNITSRRSVEPPGYVDEIAPDTFNLSTIDYDLQFWRDRGWEWFEWLADPECHDPIELDPNLVDRRDAQGWTPLIRAAYVGDVERVRILLERGADPNLPNLNGTTPLMYALSGLDHIKGRTAAKHILRYGANSDARDRFGKSLRDYGKH